MFVKCSDAGVVSATENLVKDSIILSSEQLLDEAQRHTLFRVRKVKILMSSSWNACPPFCSVNEAESEEKYYRVE